MCWISVIASFLASFRCCFTSAPMDLVLLMSGIEGSWDVGGLEMERLVG